ncbi:tRNA (adenosine(37)-N6)-dimethylallyltransferase MiaA [Aquimarina sp. AD10]|uniref:tRNA (adenosine(37)-N6)-dimethylallyltransferase MiaA n=1 Tax=Aquimarina sp. AD10 TaxID=1714849 RepID=UPI000E533EB3|nr:tRNA (adenosine(37)-N6)-dimethylallyltransferase MiaA [Aquimarina sp. AD10]AXT63511.1 tRNA (adenosine(37)-N6)-dimethylallyltransferase MiaA [Aquimarina sp. AD10]RKM99771.1 tRNA (adenosine(37)-N6)-dimethylallyltransferase MiaA [Aquimarina sp. AD10]
MNKNLIVIVGPTAIGKTNLSIQLANHFNCEIISGDSRQFYKEMKIGTAVPSDDELALAKHHFIQHKSIHETYTVGDFEKEALNKLKILFDTNDYAILVGGSGLYIDAVTKGLDYFPEVDINTREQLQKEYDTNGIQTLQERLKVLDKSYYDSVDLQNTHRVMRALEVCLSSGKPYSSFLTSSKKNRPFKCIKIGITADRNIIYDRINMRVDLMIKEGLLDEAKNLYEYKTLNALNTVGYKELFKYFDQEWELDFAISEIKKNTRRFAKRQLTWFKKDTEIEWFDYLSQLDRVTKHIAP